MPLLTLAVASSVLANPVTIAFDPLEGANGSPYEGHVEVGHTIAPVLGEWRQAHAFGNPVPAIFSNSTMASISVTNDETGLFTLESVDFGNANINSTIFYAIEGYFDGELVLEADGLVDFNGFVTAPSPDPDAILDELILIMELNDGSSYNIDNIVVETVPAPGAALVLGLGLFARRRR